MSLRAWVLLLALAFIWGSSFMFGAIALQQYSPVTVLFFRVGLGFLTLYILIKLWGKSLLIPANWKIYALLGLVNNFIPFGLILLGQTKIDSGLASVVNGTTPFFGLIIAHLFTQDEKITPAKLLGLIFGFLGVGALMLPSIQALFFAEQSDSINHYAIFIGCLLILGASFSYGIASVTAKMIVKTEPVVTATGMLFASTIYSAITMLIIDGVPEIPTPSTAVSVLSLGVFCSALAYILYFSILKIAGAVNLMLVTLLIPPVAIILGVIILDEIFTSNQAIGLGLIIMGLLIIDGRIWKKLTAKS